MKKFLKQLKARFAGKPARPLPWRPFHAVRLEGGPEPHLRGREDDPGVRAVMELLEEEILREADDLGRVGTEHLPRSAGMIEALRNLHAKIELAVRG